MRAPEVAVRPLIRWAGSKRRLVPTLLKCAPAEFVGYVEPFAGAACFFLAIRSRRAVLGDINPELIHFYRTVRKSPTEVASRVFEMPNTPEFYYWLRSQDLPSSPIERAGRFFYLNRHCFNGVYRANRSGKFNVPRGTKVGKTPGLEEFRRFAAVLRGVRLVGGDFEKSVALAAEGDFVYLDPPYTCAAARYRGEYGYTSFSDEDLPRLSRAVLAAHARGVRVLISYREERELCSSLPGWCVRKVTVRRHVAGFAQNRRRTNEILIANYALPTSPGPRHAK
jgi:DNA adenine methylase